MARAVLNLSKKTVLFIVEKVRTIVTAMTGNATYPTPSPTLPTITTQVDDLETKYQDAIDGGKSKKVMVKTAKKTLMSSLSVLIGYIQGASGGDSDKILSAGVDVQKPRSSSGILNPPQRVRTKFGFMTGEILLLYGGVAKRLFYRIQINPTPGDANGWVDYTYTTKLRVLLTGLTSGREYAIRIATVSADGTGTWSDPVLQRVL